MRKRTTHAGITVQAIAGNHAVFLGLDLDPAHRDGCLGFAIQRASSDDGVPKWLAGFKTFRSVVPDPDLATTYLTRQHPVQSFYWGDYGVEPGRDYTYRVVPLYGSPAKPRIKPHVDATLTVRTNDPATGVHGIRFNRGVAASQAYERRLAALPSDLGLDEKREAMKPWLSRGLHEALTGFVRDTPAGGVVRAAVYELTEPGVLQAFADAHAAGVDLQVVYHARDDECGDRNRAAIAVQQLDPAVLIPRVRAALAHNKFMVRGARAANGTLVAQAVWTGSTNLSEGGIFGHSNVGHEVRSPEVARRFLAYWDQLAADPTVDGLRDWVSVQSPFDPAALAPAGTHALFSPRHGLDPLRWYGDRFAASGTTAHITLAFGMTTIIEKAVADWASGLHFVLLDRQDDHQAAWSDHGDFLVAVGSAGGPDSLTRWAKEHLTGFNAHVPYLHTKILLVDPLGADPTVVTGSANFSPDSTNTNDENMLVIRGDLDVADVYFTEFARIFQHFYARYWAARLVRSGHPVDGGFLTEDDTWQEPYLTGAKLRLRLLYSSEVAGNTP